MRISTNGQRNVTNITVLLIAFKPSFDRYLADLTDNFGGGNAL